MEDIKSEDRKIMASIFRDAATRIMEDGDIHKGNFVNDDWTAFCVFGHLGRAESDGRYCYPTKSITSYFKNVVPDGKKSHLVAFNDRKSTTADDVASLLLSEAEVIE